MPRILPERTVEAWTTAYITRWDPSALLWAPTQRDPRAWDLSARSGSARHFVLEYKGIEGYPEPYVPIDRGQLRAYVALNDSLGATLVWYVLAAWTFQVQRGQILPPESEYRVLRAIDPRPDWRAGVARPIPDSVTDAPGTRDEMALARGCEAYFYVADPTPPPSRSAHPQVSRLGRPLGVPSQPRARLSGGTNTRTLHPSGSL